MGFWGNHKFYHWISTILLLLSFIKSIDFDLEQDIYLRIKGFFSSKPVASINPYYDLKYLDNYIPQLFLYSNADKLILSGVSVFLSHIDQINMFNRMCIFRTLNHSLNSGKVLACRWKQFASTIRNMLNCLQNIQRNIFNVFVHSSVIACWAFHFKWKRIKSLIKKSISRTNLKIR